MSAKTIKSMRDAFNMTKQRCYNPNCGDYKHYGARGIRICDRWLESFDNYLSDMGLRPEGMTLERKENSGDYSPENCVWATRSTQSQNRRRNKLVTFEGKTLTVAAWEREKGFNAGTLKARLGVLGYTIEEAFSKDVKCGVLLEGKAYKHMEDQSWRNTDAMHANPTKPSLDEVEIEEIRLLVAEGLSRSLVARAYGSTTTTISSVVDRKGAYHDL